MKKYRKGPRLPDSHRKIDRAEKRLYAFRLWQKGHSAGHIAWKINQKWPGLRTPCTDADVLLLADAHWSLETDLHPGEK
jgi:hypothetical protein